MDLINELCLFSLYFPILCQMSKDLKAGKRKFDTCIVVKCVQKIFSRLNLWYFTTSPSFLVPRLLLDVAFRAAVWGREDVKKKIIFVLGWFFSQCNEMTKVWFEFVL